MTDVQGALLPPTDPAELPAVFEAAFNSGDLALVDRLFAPGAVFVTRPGEAVTEDARRAANARFLELGVPIALTLRHTYVCEDIALLVGDFVISGTGPDGEPVHQEGSATDVARRGPDGRWRYVIDNPSGTDRG
ncbi:YybH family protein [Streptomyces sp. NPDC099050]|uniref:YybH family protein n=1 Tax=Streptomyces sp. NPDC099050 TaxID=3366100 RepID=UPI00382B9237